jgi:hypothetical protein
LNWVNKQDQQKEEKLGATKRRKKLAEIIEFEYILGERIQELNMKLKDSDTPRESDKLIN